LSPKFSLSVINLEEVVVSVETSFGRWLQLRRKALDLTQEELAQRLGYSAETIRKIEAGARHPSRQMAERLTKVLEMGQIGLFYQSCPSRAGGRSAEIPHPRSCSSCPGSCQNTVF
jgi:ribosome-binding protein aMBF1 (putative translation factor)